MLAVVLLKCPDRKCSDRAAGPQRPAVWLWALMIAQGAVGPLGGAAWAAPSPSVPGSASAAARVPEASADLADSVGVRPSVAATTSASTPASTPAPVSPAVLRFVPEKDYGPFVYQTETGAIAGLSVELLALIQQRSGLQIQTLPAQSLQAQLALMRQGQAELISSLRPTPERSQFLRFSLPYVSVPAVLMARQATGATDARALVPPLSRMAGQSVAVGAGYAVEAFVRHAYPQVRWQAVSDDAAALRGVVEGRFDAAVLDAASASFVMQQQGLSGLASLGEVGFEYELSFAVPLAREDLQRRIDEAIRQLPSAERQAVVSRWLLPLHDSALRARMPVALLAAAGLMALGVLVGVGWWLRRSGAATAEAPR